MKLKFYKKDCLEQGSEIVEELNAFYRGYLRPILLKEEPTEEDRAAPISDEEFKKLLYPQSGTSRQEIAVGAGSLAVRETTEE